MEYNKYTGEGLINKNGVLYKTRGRGSLDKMYLCNCPCCCKSFYSSKQNTKYCSTVCVSSFNKELAEQRINRKHYKKDTRSNPVDIFTNTGYRFTVDNEDLDSVLKFQWTRDKHGYLVTSIKKESSIYSIKLHRYILGNPNYIIDHINKDPSDNRKSNLRLANKKINSLNMGETKRSGVLNIKQKRNGKYQVRISHHTSGKRIVITKTFTSITDAKAFRDSTKEGLINEEIKRIQSSQEG